MTELQAGLKITGINDYLFITEPEAIAVEYGYYKNLNKEFDTQPLTVLFVGVGFAAAQVFAVTYTQVCADDACDRRTTSRSCITLHRSKCRRARSIPFFWTWSFSPTTTRRVTAIRTFVETEMCITACSRGY